MYNVILSVMIVQLCTTHIVRVLLACQSTFAKVGKCTFKCNLL